MVTISACLVEGSSFNDWWKNLLLSWSFTFLMHTSTSNLTVAALLSGSVIMGSSYFEKYPITFLLLLQILLIGGFFFPENVSLMSL